MILTGYTLFKRSGTPPSKQSNQLPAASRPSESIYHFVTTVQPRTSPMALPGQEAQSLVYIRVQQAARLGYRDRLGISEANLPKAYNPVLLGKKWELLGIESSTLIIRMNIIYIYTYTHYIHI